MIADNGDNSTKHHTMHKHTWTYAKKPNQKHKCFVPFEIYHQCPIYNFRMTWSFYGQEQWGDLIYYAAASFGSRRGPMVITTDHMWANIAKQSWPKCVDCLNGFESLWSWWSMTIGHGVSSYAACFAALESREQDQRCIMHIMHFMRSQLWLTRWSAK